MRRNEADIMQCLVQIGKNTEAKY